MVRIIISYLDDVSKLRKHLVCNAWEREERTWENKVQIKERYRVNDGVWNKDGINQIEKWRENESCIR